MTSPRIERLRDRLLRRGMLESIAPPATGTSPELVELSRRVRPFAEAMYLVLAVDADLGDRERDVLRGALRTLTDGLLSSSALETMLAEFEQARTRDGIELRLDALASQLYADRGDAELTLALVIAAAEVDRRLEAREQALVYTFAERLGIARREVDALLDGDPS